MLRAATAVWRGRVVLLLLLLLPLFSGCSETSFRRNSLSEVEVDSRRVLVSWVRVPSRGIDLLVSGAAEEDRPAPRLELATAQHAAERVAARRCLLDRVHPVFAPVRFADGQVSFRYVCGR